MTEYGEGPEWPDLLIRRGRPSGMALGVLTGGAVAVLLGGRSARGPATFAVVAVVAVAVAIPALVGRRTTSVSGGQLRTWGLRGPSSARQVDLATLTRVRYVPGGRGPARLQLGDAAGGRVSVPLPSTGPQRAALLAQVGDAVQRNGAAADPRTRQRLGLPV